MKNLVLYVHGKGGSAVESEHYKPLFPGCQVLGLDYETDCLPEAAAEIRKAVEKLRPSDAGVILVANSIGAYFSMCAGIDAMIRRAYFISPILDLEQLIREMMAQAKVTEAELAEKGEISTDLGQVLSWAYLCDVRNHPPQWRAPTRMLYGSKDNLTAFETASTFAQAHGAGLTVMEGGEHWFHTPEQMAFLDRWILETLEPLEINGSTCRVLRFLGRGKGGYSYLAEREGEQVVLKQIHHEPCDYYSFGNKIESELRDYHRLREAGIPMPRMLELDLRTERILKEYVEGPTVAELLRAGRSAEPWLPQVRKMAALAKASGLNIDYYPTNFVVHDGQLWYVDYECNAYSEQWDFEHWGIRHWIP